MESSLKAIKNLGLSENQAKVFLYLSKTGPKKVGDLKKHIELSRVQLYQILKSLQKKGLVESTFDYPAKYNAIPFDEVLDLFISHKEEEATILRKNKEKILQNWNAIKIIPSDKSKNKFMILQSDRIIFSKIKQMVSNAKKSIIGVSTIQGFIHTNILGMHDMKIIHSLKDTINLKFLTNFTDSNLGLPLIKELGKKSEKLGLFVETRLTNLESINFPKFFIIDSNELLFFLTSNDQKNTMNEMSTGLWTNNKSLVFAFKIFFNELWKGSKCLK